MQVFISEDNNDDPFHTYKYYRPLIWSGGNAYVGYEGQSHYDLSNTVRTSNGAENYREGVMFTDGEIKWREDLGHGVERWGAEPEPGVNGAILDALGSDPDFKFSGWNSRMRIQ